jgi:hypothetical protein
MRLDALCWREAAPSLGPGDEHRLADAFADLAGVRQGYEWATTPAP